MDNLDFTEHKEASGYQPRQEAVILTDKIGRCYCRSCNGVIPKHTTHLYSMSHLSSGRRSDLHICAKCLLELAAELGKE